MYFHQYEAYYLPNSVSIVLLFNSLFKPFIIYPTGPFMSMLLAEFYLVLDQNETPSVRTELIQN